MTRPLALDPLGPVEHTHPRTDPMALDPFSPTPHTSEIVVIGAGEPIGSKPVTTLDERGLDAVAA